MYGYPGGAHGGFQGYDSPSAAMALGGMDLGIEGLGTPGGTGMGGIDVVRGNEDERRKKLAAVVEILKFNKGRLSEAGIERLTQKYGLESMWETQTGPEGLEKILIIAGMALSLDIIFRDNVVKKVMLSFPDAPEMVTRHTSKAGEILTRDLDFQGTESPLTKKLDRFAANLESLAVLDKLSVIPGLNCYEAIAGVYESLERLHSWEVEKLKESEDMSGKSADYLGRVALCTKSGRPAMHTRDRLGLNLEYWQEKRRLKCNGTEKVWSLTVECASLPALGLYPPLRVSSDWISKDVSKANQPAEELFVALEGGPTLDWLEPENTLLSPKAEDQTTDPRYPEVMFVAKFDPPIVVPYNVASGIYTSTHSTMDLNQMLVSFDTLLFPARPGEDKADTSTRIITRERQVPIFDEDGVKTAQTHKTYLWMERAEWARTMTEIPFTHPRQLIEMLPFLRQYAFITTILNKLVETGSRPPEEPKTTVHMSKKTEFEQFMFLDTEYPKDKPLKLDVSFKISPEPHFGVSFPFQGRSAQVTFAIKAHGAVEVTSQTILGGVEQKNAEKGVTVADLGRMLEITEDIGIWVEYVRRRLG